MFSNVVSTDPTARVEDPTLANYSDIRKTEEDNERFTTTMAKEELAHQMSSLNEEVKQAKEENERKVQQEKVNEMRREAERAW